MSTQQAASGSFGWASPSLGGLFWTKAAGDFSMKVFLGVFHISILAPAVRNFGQPFSELPEPLASFFEALALGELNLGIVIAIALTVVFLATPPAAFFLWEKYYSPTFWQTPSPNRLILGSVIFLYGSLLCVELTILAQNVMATAVAQQNPNDWDIILGNTNLPTSPFIQAALALLTTALGVCLGAFTSKLLLQVEAANLFNQGRN